MVKIEILEACSGLDFTYYHGEQVETSPERAADLTKHGKARYLPETATVPATGQTATTAATGQTATVKPKGETRKKA